ncbi:transposase family protein [Actinomadura darangshiensis]|uniref:Transposase family protein n=1 Tax=Actinomadura darangshiensis TaxID=705336 RepID=A0A4R4ZYY1_9ACTN|nr:transposase family protein [Actinomadura darangshiensis]
MGSQALPVLVYIRKGETFAELGARLGVSTTTAWRYINETVELPAARSPKPALALRNAVEDGLLYLALDDALTPIDRIATDRPFYSGKHKQHGIEPAGHLRPRRRNRVGVGRAARRSTRPEARAHLGASCAPYRPPNCWCWRTRHPVRLACQAAASERGVNAVASR